MGRTTPLLYFRHSVGWKCLSAAHSLQMCHWWTWFLMCVAHLESFDTLMMCRAYLLWWDAGVGQAKKFILNTRRVSHPSQMELTACSFPSFCHPSVKNYASNLLTKCPQKQTLGSGDRYFRLVTCASTDFNFHVRPGYLGHGQDLQNDLSTSEI